MCAQIVSSIARQARSKPLKHLQKEDWKEQPLKIKSAENNLGLQDFLKPAVRLFS